MKKSPESRLRWRSVLIPMLFGVLAACESRDLPTPPPADNGAAASPQAVSPEAVPAEVAAQQPAARRSRTAFVHRSVRHRSARP